MDDTTNFPSLKHSPWEMLKDRIKHKLELQIYAKTINYFANTTELADLTKLL